MLFWLILGTILLVSGLRARDLKWYYSEELAGSILPAAFAAFLMPGFRLLNFEEPGFQGLGLVMIACSATLWLTAIMTAVGLLVEMIFDLVEDCCNEK